MWPLTESLTVKPSVAHEMPSLGGGGGAMVSREVQKQLARDWWWVPELLGAAWLGE